MTSGAHVSPLDTGCHRGSLGSASSLASQVTRSSERVTWMFTFRLPVAYAYHPSSVSRMNGSAKLASITGLVNVPAAALGAGVAEGRADGAPDPDALGAGDGDAL